MSKITTAIIATLIVLAAISGTAVWINTSPWLMWYLLPADNDYAIVSADNPPLHVIANVTAETFDLTLPMPPAQHYGYAHTATGDTIVIQPELKQQFTAAASLARNGWHVERIGLLLRGSRETAATPPIRQALQDAARQLTTGYLPTRPAAIARATATTAPLYIIATATNDGLSFLTTPDLTQPGPPFDTQPGNMRAIVDAYLPGHALKQLPEALQQAWNEEMWRSLGFTHTRPDIISYLSQFNHVSLLVTNDDSAIAVSGATTAAHTTLEQWVQDEERHRRPAKQAFRLPDGTLGYEEVPGEAAAVFLAPNNGCQAPVPDRTAVWLCNYDNHVTLSSSEEHARQVTIADSATWHVRLAPNTLATCRNSEAPTFCRLTNVSLIGDTNHTIGHVNITPAQ